MRGVTCLFASALLLAITVTAEQNLSISTACPAVHAVFSRDGKQVAVACRDKVRLYSLPAVRLLHTFETIGEATEEMGFSKDGQRFFVSGDQGSLKVWKTDTGQEQFHYKFPILTGVRGAFSPDGALLAVAPNGAPVEVFDLTSNRSLYHLDVPIGGAGALVFSPDGAMIAASDRDTTIRLFDARTGKLRVVNEDMLLETFALVFTKEGSELIAGGADKSLSFLDVNTGKVLRSLPKQTDTVAGLHLSSDGKSVLTIYSNETNDETAPSTAAVWELASGRIVQTWAAGTKPIGGGCAPDGPCFVAAGTDMGVEIYYLQ
jgi:WD40 repeat protein